MLFLNTNNRSVRSTHLRVLKLCLHVPGDCITLASTSQGPCRAQKKIASTMGIHLPTCLSSKTFRVRRFGSTSRKLLLLLQTLTRLSIYHSCLGNNQLPSRRPNMPSTHWTMKFALNGNVRSARNLDVILWTIINHIIYVYVTYICPYRSLKSTWLRLDLLMSKSIWCMIFSLALDSKYPLYVFGLDSLSLVHSVNLTHAWPRTRSGIPLYTRRLTCSSSY